MLNQTTGQGKAPAQTARHVAGYQRPSRNPGGVKPADNTGKPPITYAELLKREVPTFNVKGYLDYLRKRK